MRQKRAGISAVIAADVAVMSYARRIGQEVHLSTQLNISNVEALRFYAQFADVVVLARELNLEQVAEIYRHIRKRIFAVLRGHRYASRCFVTVHCAWQFRANVIFHCMR